jgi:hypothetical protein
VEDDPLNNSDSFGFDGDGGGDYSSGTPGSSGSFEMGAGAAGAGAGASSDSSGTGLSGETGQSAATFGTGYGALSGGIDVGANPTYSGPQNGTPDTTPNTTPQQTAQCEESGGGGSLFGGGGGPLLAQATNNNVSGNIGGTRNPRRQVHSQTETIKLMPMGPAKYATPPPRKVLRGGLYNPAIRDEAEKLFTRQGLDKPDEANIKAYFHFKALNLQSLFQLEPEFKNKDVLEIEKMMNRFDFDKSIRPK